MVISGNCSACHRRPATRIFTAPIRPDGPIEEAAVCDACYPILVNTMHREVIESAAEVVERYGRVARRS
jgi:protein-arginine kinase activator protein McsA